MSFAEVCSALVKEPFNLTVPEIARLTDHQLQHVYFRPDANQKWDRLAARGEPVSQFWVFWDHHRRHGMTDDAICALWREKNPGFEKQAVVDPEWHRG